MKPLDDLIARAKEYPRHIVLAEGNDPRIIEGAVQAAKDGFAKITLLGDYEKTHELVGELALDDLSISITDPKKSDLLEEFSKAYIALRSRKNVSAHVARRLMTKPLNFSAMMVHLGLADGSLAGAVFTSAQTMRAALHIIGKSEQYDLISSFFIMLFCEPFHDIKGALIFSDCALIVDPSAEQLAQIAITSGDSAARLLGHTPRIAMLSFSTHGSAKHQFVDTVRDGTLMACDLRPDLIIEGEMQLDAALVPEVQAQKAPGSKIAGQANVLVFPNLKAGNIGYKIAERLGKAKAIGPILQGLAKPANDLSRGCSTEDVYRMIAVTVAQARE